MVSITSLELPPPSTPMAVSLRSSRVLDTGGWRTFRPEYVTRPSPCNLDCPAGTDVRAFLAAAADGDAETAWRTIREHNPFPGICGRVCYHPCERNCNRAALDERVAIHSIERAIGDEAIHWQFHTAIAAATTPRRIAIVGAGPAGLSCAYHLARRWHHVRVFDAMPKPGGMLRYGIPGYRLPRGMLTAEVEALAGLGIEFATGVRLGDGLDLDELGRYDAVFLAIGAQRSRELAVPGRDLPGIRSGVEFLREANSTGAATLSGPAIVIGGGNTALDAARVALRSGAQPTIVYRRSRDEMPAHPDEIAQAEDEGIRFVFHAAPIGFIDRGGRVAGVELQRMRPGAADASGRRSPEPVEGATFELAAARVFLAIGEEVEGEALARLVAFSKGRLQADRFGRTARPALFAGGDAATGAGTVVEAIGSGRRAAAAIQAHFEGREPTEETLGIRVGPEEINLFYIQRAPRARHAWLPQPMRQSGFEEVVRGLPWDRAVEEARRCIICGSCTRCDNCAVFCPDAAVIPVAAGYQIDLAHCKGCGVCVAECPRGAIVLAEEAAL